MSSALTYRPILHQSKANGFSMAELLIVIALIAIMVTGVGVAFRGGDSATALTSAQSTLGALFTSAQMQATTSGRDVYVMLDMNPGSLSSTPIDANDGFLRRFVVFRHTPDDSNEYHAIGKPVFLPQGAYVSPPVNTLNGYEWPVGFDNERRLTMGGANPGGFGDNFTLPSEYTGTWYGWKISPNGRIASADMHNQIVLVAGGKLPSGFVTVDAENVYQTRGVKISYYGQVSMIDYYEQFTD